MQLYIFNSRGGLTGPTTDLDKAIAEANELAWQEDTDVFVLDLEDDVVVEGYYLNMNKDIVTEDRYNGMTLEELLAW